MLCDAELSSEWVDYDLTFSFHKVSDYSTALINTFKYHVFCIDGKISVRINLPIGQKHTYNRWDDGGK